MNKETVLGIIGGSGLYEIEGFEGEWHHIETPWGMPSDHLYIGKMNGLKMVFLPRHGRGHRLSPSDINYRANIDALKRVGVTDLISISACGSFRDHMPPSTFVIIDQFIDRTKGRENSFFGTGCVAHVSMAYPVSEKMSTYAENALKSENIPYHKGGTYLAMEGPQFSTLAESHLYRSWGCDVIGMTNMPEARLAREAELCYTSLAMVTDFDSWHPDYGEINIPELLATLKTNSSNALKVIKTLSQIIPKEFEPCPTGCDTALEHAIVTSPEARDPELVAKLDVIAGRVLRGVNNTIKP